MTPTDLSKSEKKQPRMQSESEIDSDGAAANLSWYFLYSTSSYLKKTLKP